MTQWSKKLSENLKNPFATKVFYFASAEENILSLAAEQVKKELLEAAPCDYMQMGKDFELAELCERANTVSFFGAGRIIELKDFSPAALSDKEIKTMSDLFATTEDTVLILTTVYADKRTATGKRFKTLFAAAQKLGFAAELAKPSGRENIAFITQCAHNIGTSIDNDAAQSLLERAGEDWLLLKNDVEKLAAMAGYSTITKQLVEKNSVSSVDADVFELARYITSGKQERSFEKVKQLFSKRIEPIAIAAALSGSFVDMYRVHCGTKEGLPVGSIFKEMGYFGNEYRLQKAKETSLKYSEKQLERCVLCLASLDKQLKSSPISDKQLLLEAAVADLLQIGRAA